MKIAILDVNNSLWLETLSQLSHDVYHLPDYVALDARRTQTLPEAFLLQDEDKIFFAPYLLRSCSDITDSSDEEIYDIISPYGYPGILMSEAAINNPEFPDFALQKFRQTLQERGVCSAFLRLHPILGEKFAKAKSAFLAEGEIGLGCSYIAGVADEMERGFRIILENLAHLAEHTRLLFFDLRVID